MRWWLWLRQRLSGQHGSHSICKYQSMSFWLMKEKPMWGTIGLKTMNQQFRKSWVVSIVFSILILCVYTQWIANTCTSSYIFKHNCYFDSLTSNTSIFHLLHNRKMILTIFKIGYIILMSYSSSSWATWELFELSSLAANVKSLSFYVAIKMIVILYVCHYSLASPPGVQLHQQNFLLTKTATSCPS